MGGKEKEIEVGKSMVGVRESGRERKRDRSRGEHGGSEGKWE